MKKINGISRSRADKAFDILDYILLTIAFLLVAYPLYFVVIASVSDPTAVYEGRVLLYPIKPTLEGYARIFSYDSLFVGYKNTLIYAVIGTAINVVLTVTAGYALSRKELVGRNVMMMGVMFTMIFSGGTIPNYPLVRSLGLYNTIWSLILPAAISTYYMIILKSFFSSLPESLEEAATIDGANDFQILVRIYLPLSLASLATITLFYAVFRWNRFDDALYYIQDRNLYPLQLKLYNAIKNTQQVDLTAMQEGSTAVANNISQSIESATIIFATLPILVVYPFVQRYFVSGVTIGAVKG